MFALVMNYINKRWEPCHVITTIFEVHETLGVAMAIQLKDLLTSYILLDKVIAYVKDEGANLNTFTTTLTNIVCYVYLLLSQPYVINCYVSQPHFGQVWG